MIVNCGFPESTHNDLALAICRDFARQTGFAWAGGLKLGGGEGLVHGVPLDQLDGRATPLKRSLEIAARSLAAGGTIPPEAVALMAKPVVPGWLYMLAGVYGWRRQAKQHNVQGQLKMRPYKTM